MLVVDHLDADARPLVQPFRCSGGEKDGLPVPLRELPRDPLPEQGKVSVAALL